MTYPYYTNTSQQPIRQADNSAASRVPHAVFPAIAGGITGILAVIGENLMPYTPVGEILSGFGQLSTGVFLWAVLCTGIAVLSKNRLSAAAGVFCFLLSMLTAYYITAEHFILDYDRNILLLRALALIPATLAGLAAWSLRHSGLLRKLSLIPAGLCFLFDLRVMGFSEMPMFFCEVALGILFLVILRYGAQQDVHPPVPYYSSAWAMK